ncbi:MAG: hypothetical protein Q9196_001248 [Gyalolechia fulgens]
MSNLPAEIWHIICGYLDREYLPSLRLVCTKIAHVAATPLFAEIYVNWLPRSFHRLTAIAAHPHLRRLVKTLFFEQCLLDKRYKDFELWREVADNRFVLFQLAVEDERKGIEVDETMAIYRSNICRHGIPRDDETLKCLHQVVTVLLHEQKSLLKDPHLLPVLAGAMAKLVSLRTIQTVSGRRNLDCDNMFDQPSVDDRSQRAAYSLQSETFLAYPFCLSVSTEQLLKPLDFVLKAMRGSTPAVRVLTIADLPFDSWESNKPNGYWNAIDDAFGNLHSLKLCLIAEGTIIPPTHQQIAHFIGRCRSITAIELDIDERKRWSVEDPLIEDPWDSIWGVLRDISDLLGRLHLCHLQRLQINRFRISEEAFVSFMTQHAATLRSISFSQSYMTSPGDHVTRIPSWERAIRQVAPLMSLTHVDLGRFRDSMISDLTEMVDSKGANRLHSSFFSVDYQNIGHRHQAYCRRVSDYLRRGGEGDYPKPEPRSDSRNLTTADS